MIRRTPLVAFALLALVACRDTAPSGPQGGGAPASRQAAAERGPQGERWVVRFRDGVADAPGLARALTGQHGGRVTASYQHALKGFAGALPEAAVRALRADPNVLSVEPDQRLARMGVQLSPPWGLDRIGQRALPLNGSYSYGADGAGVTVYVLDGTFNRTHADLGGRLSAPAEADFVGGPACLAVDDDGHGTHVAATIGGATYGVAKKATLVGVRVMDCGGGGYVSGVIAGVDWVTGRHAAGSPAVANMSMGTDAGEGTLALEEAIRRSIADGVTYTIAAGNGDFFGNALDACWFSPARVSQAITVSATIRTDAKSSFANFGSCVDVFAPGTDVKSAWTGGSGATRVMSGTSMAAPHVAGAAALYLQRHRSASPAQVWTALRDSATKGVLRSVGTGSPNRLLFAGVVGTSAEPADAPPVPRITYRCTGRSCAFDGTTSTDDTGIVAYGWAFTTGGTGQGPTITRTLPANTAPQVILTVTDRSGQRRSTVRTLTCSSTACR